MELGDWNREMEVGDTVEIRIDPENPKNIAQPIGDCVMAVGIGLVFGFCSLQNFREEKQRRKKNLPPKPLYMEISD